MLNESGGGPGMSRIWSPSRAKQVQASSPSTMRKLPSLNLENIKIDKKELNKLMNRSPKIR